MKNTVKMLPQKNNIFDFLNKQSKLASINFFNNVLYFEVQETKKDLIFALMDFQNMFEEFNDIIIYSIFQTIVFDLKENQRLEEMTNKDIIQEIIFQLL